VGHIHLTTLYANVSEQSRRRLCTQKTTKRRRYGNYRPRWACRRSDNCGGRLRSNIYANLYH
jgi:hypothetical protein